MIEALHQGVMIPESIELLHLVPEKWYVDCTFGRGGHTQAMLAKGVNVLALDCDQTAIAYGTTQFASEIKSGKLRLVRTNFSKLDEILRVEKLANQQIGGYFFDFGTSVDQIKAANRGFSFDHPNDPLDMRMDDRLGVKAVDLLKLLNAKEIAQILRVYGGEEMAWQIAKAIETAKLTNPKLLDTVGGLVSIIERTKQRRSSYLHPATKTFQALRIVVNDELTAIEAVMKLLPNVVAQDTTVVCIAFHEGEDRIIKQQFLAWEKMRLGKKLTKKPFKPSATEIEKNIKSRSAKLRGFQFGAD